MASAAFLLAPLALPKHQQKEEYIRWQDKLDKLIDYRGGYRKIKRLSQGEDGRDGPWT